MKSIQRSDRARVPIALVLGATILISISACSTSGSNDSGKVTITVGDRPTSDEAASRTVFDAQVKAFEKANPNITVKAVETDYDVTTFQTLLAGGKLPDTLLIPFTDPQTLIARKQVADITSEVKQIGLDKVLSPGTLSIVQDSKKNIFAIPIGGYAVGLMYNRDLFTQAGLDPNKPPTTWNEVASDAKAITDATGVAGYAQMASGNCGGWMLTSMTYAFGGRVESKDGKKVVFTDTPAMASALDFIKKLKWNEGAMGDQTLYDCGTITQDFAAGKVGMYLKASDDYEAATVQYKMSPEAFGVTAMPQFGDEPKATLTGGTAAMVNPKATAAQRLAAVKWINFEYLSGYTDKATAIAGAKASAADGAPVAIPGLPVVGEAAYKQYFDWVAPYNNVPVKNFATYTDALATQDIIPEPVNSAQKVYAALDSAIQAVLSDKSTDIETLLKNTQKTIATQLAQ